MTASVSLEQFVHPKQAACVEVFFSSWQESRWCVSPSYDFLIEEAVSQGYTHYEDLPRDSQHQQWEIGDVDQELYLLEEGHRHG